VDSPIPDNTLADLDTRLLSNFIYELNIARRHVTSYPSNHPVIGTAVEKVLQLLTALLSSRNAFTLGIAKNTLLVGETLLDHSNPVCVDLANLLFSQGIAAITFHKKLTPKELLAFYGLIILKREQVEEEGGLTAALARRGITCIQVQTIDYRAFQTTEEELLDGKQQPIPQEQPSLLWENFARSLMAGSLSQEDQLVDLDPAVLAELLNRRKDRGQAPRTESDLRNYAKTISHFIQQLEKERRSGTRQEMIRRLATFISHLSPELRSQFINSVFSSLANSPGLAESVLSTIPEEAVIDALEELNARQESLPQMMLGIIGRLSGNLAQKVALMTPESSGANVEERLRTIFKEDSLDKFLPENYQKQLQSIVSQGMGATTAYQSEIEALKQTLAGHIIEEQISSIILDILQASPAECDLAVMERNLVDLCGYFLGLGDFATLVKIYERMRQKAFASQDHLQQEVLGVFAKSDFIEEILNGLRFWGKNKYSEIGALINMVGEPFVEPLLERLAEEQSMSLRRYYMERLRAIGGAAKHAALERLRDNRWYFIRNLVLLLRDMEDPDVIPQLRRLTGHAHPKVRQEAIRALLHFRDVEADRLLMRSLASTDQETLLSAVRLAEGSSHPDILNRLVEILNRGGFTGNECELKSAAIHSLGMIGNPSVLPELKRLLSSRSLFRSAQLNRLKEDVVKSLKFYPKQEVISLLKTLAKSGQNEVRRHAEEIYRLLQGSDNAP